MFRLTKKRPCKFFHNSACRRLLFKDSLLDSQSESITTEKKKKKDNNNNNNKKKIDKKN